MKSPSLCRSLLAGDSKYAPPAHTLNRLQAGSYKLLILFLAIAVPWSRAADWVQSEPSPGAFLLVAEGRSAAIATSPEDFKVVGIAARDLAADIERVTGRKPTVGSNPAGPAVLIGTLGASPLIDGLVANRKLDVRELRGAWESFVIATVSNPLPGVPMALVIAGSDRRGTAFGVYELSQAIGVSPWLWWTDVTPAKKSTLYVAAGTRRFGPPSVQYRGIFINDEDWGLQPWAAKTFEPETGDIGPKTYAKVCELLLRLKANTLWPAMHPSTKAFNSFPHNKQVADDYAIVMGSSHAEPMLRNNVGEWTAPKTDYDYIHNRDGVLAYWKQRLKENGRFENIYTLGMRGIHDSNMVGPKTDAERIATLETIFTDQRELIWKYTRRNSVGGVSHPDREAGVNQSGYETPPTKTSSELVPQMFCAYKEVLALYRQGLKVPDDVTIVWPDDNFGYVRNFATAEELKRSGGFGVYYHLSYLGAPLSYLWLSTTPPALIWEEMHKAYEQGARRIWIANVGDIKPAEIGLEFFLQMAWDIDRWHADNLPAYLPTWAAREFGAERATPIASLLDAFYRLNFERRPEHLQWWLRNETPRPSPWSDRAIDARLAELADLRTRTERLTAQLPSEKRDAFEQLVGYPMRGSEIANRRYFFGERGDAARATAADAELTAATRRFNEETAGGKWRGLTSLEPADTQFKSMRIYPWKMPAFAPKAASTEPRIALAAEKSSQRRTGVDATWTDIHGLGVSLLPTTAPSVGAADLPSRAAQLGYPIDFPHAGEFKLTVYLLPTHAIVAERGLRLAVGIDGAPPTIIAYEGQDGSAEWAQGVLNNYVTVAAPLTVATAGVHVLRIYGMDAGVVLRKLTIE